MSALLFWLVLTFMFNCIISDRYKKTAIKINEPRQSYNYNYNNANNQGSYESSNTNSNSNSGEYRTANNERKNSEMVALSVVEYLTSRKGECIETVIGKYTYKICFFDRISQHENWYTFTLGIFDRWDYCKIDGHASNDDDHELCLIFTDGQKCGNQIARQAYVQLSCDISDNTMEEDHIYDVSEVITCVYHLKLYVPHICNLLGNDLSLIFKDSGMKIDKSMNTSEIVHKLDAMMDMINDDRKLNDIWKICLMSMMFKDKENGRNASNLNVKLQMIAGFINNEINEKMNLNGTEIHMDNKTTSLANDTAEESKIGNIDDICELYINKMFLRMKESKMKRKSNVGTSIVEEIESNSNAEQEIMEDSIKTNDLSSIGTETNTVNAGVSEEGNDDQSENIDEHFLSIDSALGINRSHIVDEYNLDDLQ